MQYANSWGQVLSTFFYLLDAVQQQPVEKQWKVPVPNDSAPPVPGTGGA
jgi:hypothetical protein